VQGQAGGKYRFGVFELDREAMELRKRGVLIKLQDQPFRILCALLGSPGEVVSRETLKAVLWPEETFVEFERSINAAVAKLRQTLGDSAESPRFIETLARRGYRFLAPVEVTGGPVAPAPVCVGGEAEAPPEAEAPRQVEAHLTKNKLLWPWLAVALMALAALGAAVFWRSKPAPESLLEAVPLTSYPGNADAATFSPDGSQVAFAWDGEKKQEYGVIINDDIYVHLVGSGNRPLRLTDNPRTDRRPVWSPDGRWIAFTRIEETSIYGHGKHLGDGTILLTPALGGAEREVAKIGAGLVLEITGLVNLPGLTPNGVSGWSPDGRWLVSSVKEAADQPSALYLVSAESGEKRRLTSPPAGIPGDADGVISPDGRTLAFSRIAVATVGWMASDASDVYALSLADDYSPQGKPKRLTFDNAQLAGIAWTANSREIVFSSRRGGSPALWRMAVSGSASPRPLLLSQGQNAIYPAISRQGSRLAYTQRVAETANIRRVNLSDPSQAPTVPIPSSRREVSPQYSPDGKRIVFAADRSSARPEIWVCDADGSNPSQLFTTQLTTTGYSGSPRWSPDGQRIAFDTGIDSLWQIFTVSAQGGKPRQMTRDSDNSRPSWSHDGKWIYFTSGRSGRGEIWRIPADGRDAMQITRSGGNNVTESEDAKSIWYNAPDMGIWNARIDGSAAVRVVSGPVLNIGFGVTHEGIYYFTRGPHPVLQFYRFATGKSLPIFILDKQPRNGLGVSPDGHWLLYSQIDRDEGSDLMLVDHFR
jgi:Tol biopolymer transport system component/DNA-binding winged helix-turn-helix (wHTH) protein